MRSGYNGEHDNTKETAGGRDKKAVESGSAKKPNRTGKALNVYIEPSLRDDMTRLSEALIGTNLPDRNGLPLAVALGWVGAEAG